MKHRVTLQKPSTPEGQDAGGAYTPVYVVVATVWAEVRTLTGSETPSTALDTLVAAVIHRVQIRKPWFVVRPTWQLLWEGRTFNVMGVTEPDNRQRILVLECVEVMY